MKISLCSADRCRGGTIENMGKRPTRPYWESAQWNGSSFQNSLPRRTMDYTKILQNVLLGRSRYAAPGEPVPIEARAAGDFEKAPMDGLRVTWFGHSTSLVEIGGKRILLDPVWSDRASPFSYAGVKRFHRPPLALDELPEIDAVLISHDHYDHLDRGTVVQLAQRPIRWLVPLGVGSHLEFWGVQAHQIVELDWWQEVRLGEVTLTSVPARHDSGRSIFFQDRRATLWCGWVMRSESHSVFYSGDSGLQPAFSQIGERLGPFDLTLIEIGAYDALWADQHMGPEQAVLAHRMVKGRLMIPVHWATFELAPHSWIEPIERFLVAAKAAGISYTLPRPGQSVEMGEPVYAARWWPDLPWRGAAEYPIQSSFVGHLSAQPN